MKRLLVLVGLLVALSSAASAEEMDVVVEERPQRNWFSRAFYSIEDSFRDMINKIEKGFIKSVEEKNINGTESGDGTFTNRTQEVIELNGQKYLKTKIIEQKKTNFSSSFTEREVIRPLTPEEIAKLSPSGNITNT